MQSKGAIKLLAILLAIACIYQLSFSFKTRSVEKKAAAYAAAYDGDERSEREQYYLDSVQNQPVYNLGFRKFTYKEIKEKELNLGLDLKGGMNVMLEIQVEDVVKSLAGDSKNDPAFIEAMAQAYISTSLANSIVFGVLIIVLLVKPAGLLGKYVPEKV